MITFLGVTDGIGEVLDRGFQGHWTSASPGPSST